MAMFSRNVVCNSLRSTVHGPLTCEQFNMTQCVANIASFARQVTNPCRSLSTTSSGGIMMRNPGILNSRQAFCPSLASVRFASEQSRQQRWNMNPNSLPDPLNRSIANRLLPKSINRSMSDRRLFSTTASAVHTLPANFRISTEDHAHDVVASLGGKDRALLLDALKREADKVDDDSPAAVKKLSSAEARQLFLFTSIPFIGFGLLDNLLMIIAGEYIDHTLGVFLGISTMAAAGLGNIISDVAGIGTAHYVELLGTRIGLVRPILSPSQWGAKQTRFIINLGRCLGLILGCFIGMFPLLFFDEKAVLEKKHAQAAAEEDVNINIS